MLVAVAVLLFVAAAVVMVVAIVDGTFGLTGSTTLLATGLALGSVPVSLTAVAVGRWRARTSTPAGPVGW